MKPFNLEEAKAGKPVCTREGSQVKILEFDFPDDEYPIVGRVYDACENEWELQTWTGEGAYYSKGRGEAWVYDLFMKPTKEKRWGVFSGNHFCSYNGVTVFYSYKDALKVLEECDSSRRHKYQIIEFEMEV
jgi:hypothetical protein